VKFITLDYDIQTDVYLREKDVMEKRNHFDVIIVGGRPAGATLAARLGMNGLRVLLLERAKMPSLPAASSPVIYAGTMKMLDEIGADERIYAQNTPQIRRWIIEKPGIFASHIHVPDLHGRDYSYAIDRAAFDLALWKNAQRFSGVTVRQGFSVTDLLWDGDRVAGILGRETHGVEERFTADLVVGADGRFSLVARKVKASEYDQHEHQPTTLYYAYWKNAKPHQNNEPTTHLYSAQYGIGFLLMDSADDQLLVAIEGQSPLLEAPPGQVEAFYVDMLKQYPAVWTRLENAEMVGNVRGMRKVGNLYRQAGGKGWALVGDALHQKDPLDGQGIYDAVLTAKLLSEAILDWKQGRKSWETALQDYEQAARRETEPMYRATLQRVQRELYTPWPDWAFKTALRWIFTDREYRRRWALMITRGIDPDDWLPLWIMPGMIARGLMSDIKQGVGYLTQRRRKAEI
jgi:flavin-dependent dehydrogenase